VPCTVAVDAMGGDRGPAVAVPAAAAFLRRHREADLLLVGESAAIEAALPHGRLPERCSVVHAPEVIAMDESPVRALRTRRESSMWKAIELVRAGKAHACVSAGNTGALMVIARHLLGMLEGIERPAIARFLPTPRGQTLALDLGANTECSPAQLCQFAIMGAVLVEAVLGRPEPTVGLLNVGTEPGKGTETIQRAAALIAASGVRFHGFVEGNDIYAGTTDVVVCDGFNGNVALKTSEGMARMVSAALREEFGRSAYTRLAALASWPVLRALRARLDPRRYNGASLLGLGGPVIKSHGGTDALGFEHAIGEAAAEARSAVAQRIGERIRAYLPASAVA
jgi:phosphate acyltransferase